MNGAVLKFDDLTNDRCSKVQPMMTDEETLLREFCSCMVLCNTSVISVGAMFQLEGMAMSEVYCDLADRRALD